MRWGGRNVYFSLHSSAYFPHRAGHSSTPLTAALTYDPLLNSCRMFLCYYPEFNSHEQLPEQLPYPMPHTDTQAFIKKGLYFLKYKICRILTAKITGGAN